jgi:S-adenosylmethionine hydrolase
VLVSSFGLVEVAVREGSAAERFGLSRRVSVRLSEADER